MTKHNAQKCDVLGVRIDALSWEAAVERVLQWARTRQSRYVAICNVHSVVSANRSADFRALVNGADLATPDGMPIAWYLRAHGFPGQQRINGPDFMWRLCERAAREGVGVHFYGSSEKVLARLRQHLKLAFPDLTVHAYAPPYRALSEAETQGVVAAINASGAGLVFVGLGCPKQELWMAQQRGAINAVMLGVGAAFDYHAGTLARAPRWMQQTGLEWFYRLLHEPRRLWRRYFVTNSLFLFYLLRRSLR